MSEEQAVKAVPVGRPLLADAGRATVRDAQIRTSRTSLRAWQTPSEAWRVVLVMDNLNMHSPVWLYDDVAPKEAYY